MSPDSRRHRGAHPQDPELFSDRALPALRRAVAELSWLLSRDYASAASLKLVGDRYQLRERQRNAVRHCSCSDGNLAARLASEARPAELHGQAVVIDGFNLIITLEAALGGGVLVRGRDRCLRDLSGIHGSYRRVEETPPGLRLAGEYLARAGAASVLWLLDRPVSNSGRLREFLERLAAEQGWPWTVELPMNPDRELMGSSGLVVTSDAAVLDAGVRWVNLATEIVESAVPGAWIADLRPEAG